MTNSRTIILKATDLDAGTPVIVVPEGRGDLAALIRSVLTNAVLVTVNSHGALLSIQDGDCLVPISRNDWTKTDGWQLRLSGPTTAPNMTILDAGSWASPEISVDLGRAGSPVRHALEATEGFEFELGRAFECDVQISDMSASRRHAKISCHQGSFWLEDLSSKHGTELNGTRLLGPTRLKHGDRFRVGEAMIVFSSYLEAIQRIEVPQRDRDEDFADFDPSGSTEPMPIIGGHETGIVNRESIGPSIRALSTIAASLHRIRRDHLIASTVVVLVVFVLFALGREIL